MGERVKRGQQAIETSVAPELLVDRMYDRSLDILRRSATPYGFVASAAYAHYGSIWARDASISISGALASGDSTLVEASKNTILTLFKHQTRLGMVPNAYWPSESEYGEYWDQGEAGAVDAQTHIIITARDIYKATGDRDFAQRIWPSAKSTFNWLMHQDVDNTCLVNSPEAADWMDSTLNRGGRVLHNNILFHRAAEAIEELGEELGDPQDLGNYSSKHIKKQINTLFWPSPDKNYAQLFDHVGYPEGAQVFPHVTTVNAYAEAAARDRQHYVLSVSYGNFVDKCDVLANLMAIVYGIADEDQSGKILDHLEAEGAADPYPVKSLTTPEKASGGWGLRKMRAERHQAKQWRNPQNTYHNGAIWPYIGGMYIMALQKAGRIEDAQRELVKLAQANSLGKKGSAFHEWINPKTGKLSEPSDQTWNAGMYVAAYNAVKEAA